MGWIIISGSEGRGRQILNSLRLVLALLAASCVSGCVGNYTKDIKEGTAAEVTTAKELRPPDTTNDIGAYIGTSEYRLGADDQLEISVFQVEDLNRTVRVNSQGQISLPLIGAVDAGGKTVPELERSIAAKLEEGFLRDPQVSIFVKEFASQRITMEGAVARPGIYALKGRTSLLQAMAMAGGVGELARLDGVVIFRTIDGQRMAAVFDLGQIRGGNAPDPEVYGDDIIVIDQSGYRSSIRRFMENIPFLNVFRPY